MVNSSALIKRWKESKVHNFLAGFLYVSWAILRATIIFFIPRSWRSKDVAGEIVLVTGAGNGIGRLLAIDFAKRGAEVIACDVKKDFNDGTCELIKKFGGIVHNYVCDVSDRQAVYSVAKKIQLEVGKVTILVNNAGILVGADFLDLPDDKIVKTFEVNALGPMWMCKAFLPDMLESGKGHIVNIASIGGHFGAPKLSDYNASKHAMIGFDESLKIELYMAGHTDVRTTVVCPNFFNSGLYSGLEQNSFQQEMTCEYVANEIMLGVLAEEEKVYIPAINSFLVPLKHMFPIQALIRFLEVIGVTTGMKNLKGGRRISVPEKILNR